ncbi:hypothetical protein AMTRI_Chr06g176590 [Amborella trichopoda]|uniref:Uncharacterized protein n=1 Tax=Amborella trichopoda TaxID=13333 RepID=W1PUY2_AMBTC|nr:hypothetical protein AMTR_s00049p00220580 [Amborella trichopoda]
MRSGQGHHAVFKEEVASDGHYSYIYQLQTPPSILGSGHKANEVPQHEEVGSDHCKREKKHFSTLDHNEPLVDHKMKGGNEYHNNHKPKVSKVNSINTAAGDYIKQMHKRLEMEKVMFMEE